MKVLSIEGIKGTGKSTIVTKIQENYFIRKIEKFTKGINNLPYFLTVFREEHKDYFYNADSSLALGFYANFFNRLAEIRESEIVIFERGLLSFPCSGLYGYYISQKKISFDQYCNVALSLYNLALERYRRLERETLFLIVECTKGTVLDRLRYRAIKKQSDKLFLDKMDSYNHLQRLAEDMSMETLARSNFLRLRNESPQDLEDIVKTAEIMLQEN